MSGKVLVCRCEDVTLHELEEAIARGHADVARHTMPTEHACDDLFSKRTPQCVHPSALTASSVDRDLLHPERRRT